MFARDVTGKNSISADFCEFLRKKRLLLSTHVRAPINLFANQLIC